MKRTLYLFLMLTVLLLTGCRKQSPVADKLQQAEAMMDEHPDSALNLLKGIAQPELQTQAHHARYALLYSQALDKNYIDLTNDSLISIAVDYYRHTDDVRRKFLSYYYKGRIHENAKDYPQAMIAYLDAEQLTDAWGNDYYAGLLCQNISIITTSRKHWSMLNGLIATLNVLTSPSIVYGKNCQLHPFTGT